METTATLNHSGTDLLIMRNVPPISEYQYALFEKLKQNSKTTNQIKTIRDNVLKVQLYEALCELVSL